MSRNGSVRPSFSPDALRAPASVCEIHFAKNTTTDTQLVVEVSEERLEGESDGERGREGARDEDCDTEDQALSTRPGSQSSETPRRRNLRTGFHYRSRVTNRDFPRAQPGPPGSENSRSRSRSPCVPSPPSKIGSSSRQAHPENSTQIPSKDSPGTLSCRYFRAKSISDLPLDTIVVRVSDDDEESGEDDVSDGDGSGISWRRSPALERPQARVQTSQITQIEEFVENHLETMNSPAGQVVSHEFQEPRERPEPHFPLSGLYRQIDALRAQGSTSTSEETGHMTEIQDEPNYAQYYHEPSSANQHPDGQVAVTMTDKLSEERPVSMDKAKPTTDARRASSRESVSTLWFEGTSRFLDQQYSGHNIKNEFDDLGIPSYVPNKNPGVSALETLRSIYRMSRKANIPLPSLWLPQDPYGHLWRATNSRNPPELTHTTALKALDSLRYSLDLTESHMWLASQDFPEIPGIPHDIASDPNISVLPHSSNLMDPHHDHHDHHDHRGSNASNHHAITSMDDTRDTQADHTPPPSHIIASSSTPPASNFNAPNNHITIEILEKCLQQLTYGTRLGDDVIEKLLGILPKLPGYHLIDPLFVRLDESPKETPIPIPRHVKHIVVPLHHPGVNHWSLAIISDSHINHYDSCEDLPRGYQVKDALLLWLHRLGVAPQGAPPSVNISNCPQQRDGWSCGLHVLAYARRLLVCEEIPETINMEEEMVIMRALAQAELNVNTVSPNPNGTASVASDWSASTTTTLPGSRKRDLSEAGIVSSHDHGADAASTANLPSVPATSRTPEIDPSTLDPECLLLYAAVQERHDDKMQRLKLNRGTQLIRERITRRLNEGDSVTSGTKSQLVEDDLLIKEERGELLSMVAELNQLNKDTRTLEEGMRVKRRRLNQDLNPNA